MLIDKKNKLNELHPKLKNLLKWVAQNYDQDIILICGNRTKEDQQDCFNRGVSKVQFPNSKHNSFPSLAMDIAPMIDNKIPWNDITEFKRLVEFVKSLASGMNIDIRCGADFQTLKDYPHIELKGVNP